MTKPKLIVIVGATGTGKSDLAVELALRFNGEVLNADAMQLYRGLPIITNKISEAEKKGVPHHLLGCIGLDEQPWTVDNFVSSAQATINDIHSRGRLPILVGGTHYYTQSLILRGGLVDAARDEQIAAESIQGGAIDNGAAEKWPILASDVTTSEILAKLAEVDPVMARRWHPNDRRKIQRSLEIFLQTGKRASDIYEGQRAAHSHTAGDETDRSTADSSGIATSTLLRMPTLILWIHADTKVLHGRLDARVEKMLESGLLEEVKELSSFAASRPLIDYSSGIWVSIGYKEFIPYIKFLNDASTREAAAKQSNTEERLLRDGIEATQAGTRQYAKRQVRWIRIKLVEALEAAGPGAIGSLHVLDGDSIDAFRSKVVEEAASLVEVFLDGSGMPLPESVSEKAAEVLGAARSQGRGKQSSWVRRDCEVCGVVGAAESDWVQHIASRKHKRLVGRARAAAAAAAAAAGHDDDGDGATSSGPGAVRVDQDDRGPISGGGG